MRSLAIAKRKWLKKAPEIIYNYIILKGELQLYINAAEEVYEMVDRSNSDELKELTIEEITSDSKYIYDLMNPLFIGKKINYKGDMKKVIGGWS